MVDPYSLRVSPLPVDQYATTRDLESTLTRLFSVSHSEDVLFGVIGEMSDEEAEEDDLEELERSFLVETDTDGEASTERSRLFWRRKKKRQGAQREPLTCPALQPTVTIQRDLQEGAITFFVEEERAPPDEEGEEGSAKREDDGGDDASKVVSSSSSRSSASSESSKPGEVCAKAAARLFMKLQMNSSFMMKVRQDVFGKPPDICASFTSPGKVFS